MVTYLASFSFIEAFRELTKATEQEGEVFKFIDGFKYSKFSLFIGTMIAFFTTTTPTFNPVKVFDFN